MSSLPLFPLLGSATLFVYESFTAGTDPSQGEYLAGNGSGSTRHFLTGQNPSATPGVSFGFNGPWEQAVTTFELGQVPLPSLSYSDGTRQLLTTGNLAYRQFNDGRSSRPLETLPTASSETLYLSFLLKLDNPTAEGRLEFGPQATTSTGTGLRIRAQGGNYVASIRGQNHTLGETNTDTQMFVWRVDFGEGDSFDWSLWHNPTDLTLETTPTLTGSAADLLLNHLVIQRDGGSTDGFGFAVDEVRIGSTWGSVTPIPEPSTYGLLFGLLALGAIILKKRKGIN